MRIPTGKTGRKSWRMSDCMDVHVWPHCGPMPVTTWSSAGVWTQSPREIQEILVTVDTSGPMPVVTILEPRGVDTERRSRAVVTAAAAGVDT